MAYFKVLSQNLAGEGEENHEKPQSEDPASRLRFRPDTAKM
jgi:hypothetical protein